MIMMRMSAMEWRAPEDHERTWRSALQIISPSHTP